MSRNVSRDNPAHQMSYPVNASTSRLVLSSTAGNTTPGLSDPSAKTMRITGNGLVSSPEKRPTRNRSIQSNRVSQSLCASTACCPSPHRPERLGRLQMFHFDHVRIMDFDDMVKPSSVAFKCLGKRFSYTGTGSNALMKLLIETTLEGTLERPQSRPTVTS